MRRLLLAIATCVLASATWAGTASASLYKVDVRGSSKVTWSFDGELEVGGCGTSTGNIPLTRHFTGSGTSQFEFRSKRPGQGLIMRDLRGKLFASYSADAVATGNLNGSWVISETHGGCPEFAPSPAITEETGACGGQTWNMSLMGQSDNGFMWSAGKENLGKPGSPTSTRYDECPFALSSGAPMISRVGGSAGPGLTPCETNSGVLPHRLTWELTAMGRGIPNVKVPVKAKSAGKKTVVLSRTVTKACLIPIDNGAAGSKPSLKVTVDTRLTLTFRRTVR
jgi:hypothetical protein